MDLKMFPFPEQLSNGKRKIFSSFGLGVGTSLIIATLIFLYCPVNISLYNPVPIDSSSSSSLPFSVTSTTSELQRDKEERVEEKPNHGNRINGSTNANVSQFDDNQTTHEGNFSVGLQNSSFAVSNGGDNKITQTQYGNSSEKGENSTLSSEGRVPEKTHEENFSEGSKNSSFFVSSGGDKNQTLTQYGNSSKKGESSTISSNNQTNDEGGVHEKTHEGFSSLKEKNGTNLSEGGVGEKNQLGISSNNQTNDEKINKDKSTETDKSEGSLSKEKKDFEIQRGNFDDNGGIPNSNDESRSSSVDLPGLSDKCNIFDGMWVRDEGKPYYPSGSCPHIDRDFNCHLNGRPDDDFLKWKWQPNQCNIPSFNATDFLERLRNKRLIFVGDSLNRNMWESLVCMLRHGVKNKSKVYEITGKREFKVHGFYAFRYEDYNCSVDFVSAPFLVKENIVNGKGGSSETLRLDKMDATTSAYRTADVIVFNTGHWWTHEKTSKGENYYQEGTHVYPKLEVMDAYKKALTTWARWVDKKIDPNRTRVLFRGYSVTHFKGGQWNSGGQCHKETEPIFNETYLAKYPPKMKVLEEVLQQMKTPVLYLNISKLTDYRKDGHPSIYRMKYETEKERVAAVGSQDCSHWCLPGVPDMWNELLYASLLQSGKGSWKY